MLLKREIVAAICGITLASLPACGQEDPMSKAETSIEVVSFVGSTGTDVARQSVSASLLGGYCLFFSKRCGVELSCGYTQNNQTHGLDSRLVGVRSNSDVVFAAHVYQFPAKHWSAAAMADVLVFNPKTLDRLGYGSGDLNLTRGIFPRTAHRGGFYNSATFNRDSLNGLDRFTNHEEPAIVIGYNF
jgi:hypothetical protein